jgi:hypothetical protein
MIAGHTGIAYIKRKHSESGTETQPRAVSPPTLLALASLAGRAITESCDAPPRGLLLYPNQRKILEYIAKAIRNHDRSPTIREIGEAFGIASTN